MKAIRFTLFDNFKPHRKDQHVAINDDPNLLELAAAQQKIEHSFTRWGAVKHYTRCSIILSVYIWTMILWGYENQAGGMVLSIPQFRKDFGYKYNGSYVLDAKWQSIIVAVPTATLAVGYLVGSFFGDIIGRRRIIMIGTLMGIPFVALEYVATRMEVFFAGKMLNGFCLGILSSVSGTAVSEMAPLAIRGLFSGFCSLASCTGPFICVLINKTTSTYTTRMAYRAIFIPQWIFAITALIFQCFLPESPYWLVHKGRYRDAYDAIDSMYTEEDDVRGQYALIKKTVEEEKAISSQSGSYVDCFRPKDIKRTGLVCFAFLMQAFSGAAYVTNYSTYYYQLNGFSTLQSFQIACGAQAMSVCGVVSGLLIVDRFGRRPLILGAITAMTILNFLIATTGLFKHNKGAVAASSGFMAMFNFIYNIGVGITAYILCAEIPSVFMRAKTVALGHFSNSAVQCMWTAVLPYMFNEDHANMGSTINYIFFGCCFVAIFIYYFFLPETAHRSFEEIDELFHKKVPARQWKNFTTDKQKESEKAYADMKGLPVEHIESKASSDKEAEAEV